MVKINYQKRKNFTIFRMSLDIFVEECKIIGVSLITFLSWFFRRFFFGAISWPPSKWLMPLCGDCVCGCHDWRHRRHAIN